MKWRWSMITAYLVVGGLLHILSRVSGAPGWAEAVFIITGLVVVRTYG